MPTTTRQRCAWAANSSPAMQAYHDEEWGVPQRDSEALWGKLVLDGFQAGLAWSVILHKRDAFYRAFKQFDPAKVARFTETDVERLVLDAGIVRSRAKIVAAIGNARAYLDMKKAGEDFSEWCWAHVGGQQVVNHGERIVTSPVSETISKELKKRGFKFVGPTIVYAWMQAVGMVDDHEDSCFCKQRKPKRKAPAA